MFSNLMGQAQTSGESLISRLLGIDRINLHEGHLSLSWHHPIHLGIFILVVVPAIVAIVWSIYRRERRDISPAVKWLLAGIRSALLLLVIGMLLGPVLTVEIVKFKRAYLLVLVDDSLSMRRGDPPTNPEDQAAIARVTNLWDKDEQLPDKVKNDLAKLSRADIVREALKNPNHEFTDEKGNKLRSSALQELERKLNVEYFTFSKGARHAEKRDEFLENYRNETCLGTETAIGDAIKQARSMFKGMFVAGVVIISDGRNNLGIEPEHVARQLKQQYVPIFTVCPGIQQKMKDIGLIEPQSKQTVRANDMHQLSYTVTSEGFEGDEVDISMHVYTLTKDDYAKDWSTMEAADLESLLLQAKEEPGCRHKFKLKEGSQRQRDEMTWQPKTPGEYLLIVRTPAREGERSFTNNYFAVRLRVIDDKLRVLYVEHLPRYEYRFLKNALIRDPKVLCHTLLTSADEGFPQEHSLEATDEKFKQPLKEFPKEMKDLIDEYKYDVIILGDVDPNKLGGKETLENIKRFVTDFGGGLLLLSGEMYNPRSYKGTPLEDLLPVIPDDVRKDVATQTYGYALTDFAKSEGGHTIVRFPYIGNDLPRLIEQWEDKDQRGDGLVGIRWFKSCKLKPGLARPLVEVTGVQGQDIPGKRPPLFATMDYGNGRVFWSATDETWLWRYLVGDQPWFYPFWQQTMYWSMDRKLSGARRYQLYLNRSERRYVMGEPVSMRVTAYNKDFQALQDPELDVFIEPPQGQRFTIRLSKSTEKDGEYSGSYQPRDVGQHRVWAGEEEESSRAVEKFIVYIPNREDEEPILDVPMLKRIAVEGNSDQLSVEEREKKYFFPITQIGKLPAAIQASDQQQSEKREDDLWDSPLIYLIFALLITSEWVLRKVFRML